MEIAPGISSDPEVQHGAPVLSGTRVPASIVSGSLAGGMSDEEVMRDYDLSADQLAAARSFALERSTPVEDRAAE